MNLKTSVPTIIIVLGVFAVALASDVLVLRNISTTSSPSYHVSNDGDTGIYRDENGDIHYVNNGVVINTIDKSVLCGE